MFLLGVIIGFCIFVFLVWLKVMILHKAGYSGWWVVTFYIPVLNFVMLWIFAFADWPCLRKDQIDASTTVVS